MREDGDFINQLRNEIEDGQKRRTTYVTLKLSFITGLLGLGAFSLEGPIKTSPLLYLVPLIAFIFDLYILGEDFGIKRAGIFIGTSPSAPNEERLWEEKIPGARDKLSFLACPISTFASVVAATAGIIISEQNIYVYVFNSWIFIAFLFVVFPFIYNFYRIKKLNVFSCELKRLRDKTKTEIDNRVRGSFSLPLPTPPSMRVRTRRFP